MGIQMGCCDNDNKCSKGIYKTNDNICKTDANCNTTTGGYESFTSKCDLSHHLNKWIHQEGRTIGNITIKDGPIKKFTDLVMQYGNPDVLANVRNGICIWFINKKNDPHTRIELRDEYISHCVPLPHYDFLYSYIKIYIPEDKLCSVLKTSGSVGYDPLKKEL